MTALALLQVIVAAVIASYELGTAGLTWPPLLLLLVAGLFIVAVERRRQLAARP